MEQTRVRQSAWGKPPKFTYNDYIVSAVLSTFSKKYFRMDRGRLSVAPISKVPKIPHRYHEWLLNPEKEADADDPYEIPQLPESPDFVAPFRSIRPYRVLAQRSYGPLCIIQ